MHLNHLSLTNFRGRLELQLDVPSLHNSYILVWRLNLKKTTNDLNRGSNESDTY